MYRVAICEDLEPHLCSLQLLVSQIAGCNVVQTYIDGNDLLDDLESKKLFCDIILLDISLGDLYGIELGQRINRLLPECQVIYVTAYPKFAVDVYDSDHVYFLLKSRVREKLPAAMAKAIKALEKIRETGLWISQRNVRRLVPLNEIIHIERFNRISVLTCQTQVLETPDSIDKLYVQLRDNPNFCRCHNSYILNFRTVVLFAKNNFVISGGKVIPISRQYYGAAKERFTAYLGNRL